MEKLPTHGGSLRIFAAHAGPPGLEDSALAARGARAGERGGTRGSCHLSALRRTGRELPPLAAGVSRRAPSAKARRGGLWRRGQGQYAAQFLRRDAGRHLAWSRTAIRTSRAKLLPGTHIPVVSPEELMRARPDYVLILPWNLQEEIRRQLREISAWGGRFVTPVPLVRIHDAAASRDDLHRIAACRRLSWSILSAPPMSAAFLPASYCARGIRGARVWRPTCDNAACHTTPQGHAARHALSGGAA